MMRLEIAYVTIAAPIATKVIITTFILVLTQQPKDTSDYKDYTKQLHYSSNTIQYE